MVNPSATAAASRRASDETTCTGCSPAAVRCLLRPHTCRVRMIRQAQHHCRPVQPQFLVPYLGHLSRSSAEEGACASSRVVVWRCRDVLSIAGVPRREPGLEPGREGGLMSSYGGLKTISDPTGCPRLRACRFPCAHRWGALRRDMWEPQRQHGQTKPRSVRLP